MKKFLLLGASALLGLSAMAIEPTVLEGVLYTAISPNGVWVAGGNGGSIAIKNLETGKVWIHGPGLSITGEELYYGVNHKGCSNIGIIVGGMTMDVAAYWKDGKWTRFNVPHPEFMSSAQSVTPDGRVVCGGAGMDKFSEEAESTMMVPCVWYLQDDGTYGDAVLLPHPDTDITGNIPQYITAVEISEDGKVVAGQIRDYSGLLHEPIVYFCDDDGNWTYRTYPELINPKGLEFPPYPGEFDQEMPVQEWYMTKEEIAAFNKAFEDWDGSGKMPTYEEFMTPDEIEQYQEALKAFMEIYQPWADAYSEYEEKFMELLESGLNLEFNNVALSPDGKYYASTHKTLWIDDFMPYEINHPMSLNIETGDAYIFDTQDLSILTSCITSDYSILCSSSNPKDLTLQRQSYIYPQLQDDLTPLELFIFDHDEEVGVWMEEVMQHEVITGINQFGQYITEDIICSGIPMATPELDIILCNTDAFYWTDSEEDYYSFVFPTGIQPSGVETVTVKTEATMQVEANGNVVLNGEFASLNIYDIAGATVYSARNPEGTVATSLNGGIYIFKAVTANGEEIVKKVAVK